MKAIVALLVTCFTIGCYCRMDHLPEHMHRPIEVLHDSCRDKTNAREEDIVKSQHAHIEDTPEIRCYIRCLFEASNVMRVDGTIDFGVVRHLLTENLQLKYDRLSSLCEMPATDFASRCDYAYATLRCYFDTDNTDAHLI